MAAFVDGPVRVTVPATSANLGPGFDSLGLALALRDTLTAQVAASPGSVSVSVRGAGADEVPRDATHLVVRSMLAAFDRMGVPRPAGLVLDCDNHIPHARGLGSSSAAIVAGIGLARALTLDGPRRLDDGAFVRLAADLEGHPDNVAPAVLGGLVISGRDDDGGWYAVRADVAPGVATVVLVPPTPVSTEAARGLLPPAVPHGEAAANAGRAALLVAALAGRPEQLHRATRDYLHQGYRRSAMPDSLDLVDALRADGVPAVVSGAGPTVLAFVAGDDADPPHGGLVSAADVLARCPEGWLALPLAVDPAGLVVG